MYIDSTSPRTIMLESGGDKSGCGLFLVRLLPRPASSAATANGLFALALGVAYRPSQTH